MPAPVSSLIARMSASCDRQEWVSSSDLVALWEVASTIPDPRSRRGTRYPLATILTLALAATIAGARSFAQFAAWSADVPARWWSRFGLARATPSADTFARVLGLVDPEVVEASGPALPRTVVHTTIRGTEVFGYEPGPSRRSGLMAPGALTSQGGKLQPRVAVCAVARVPYAPVPLVRSATARDSLGLREHPRTRIGLADRHAQCGHAVAQSTHRAPRSTHD